jgi:pimeloyl-ACP methyl ester carboxylesterase
MPLDSHQTGLGFVLIQGGGLGPWVWDRLIPLLNLPALAVNRTGNANQNINLKKLTIANCASLVKTEIEKVGFQRVILVGHSIGGVIAPEVAAQLPDRMAHLVFIAASIPPEGKRPLDILPVMPRLMNWLVIELQNLGISMPRGQVENAIRNTLCNDTDEETLQWVLSHNITPEPRALAFERISRANMPDVPRTYIKLLQDRTLSLEAQDQMIENLGGAHVLTLDTGHTAMVSRPKELAQLLNLVAEQTAK